MLGRDRDHVSVDLPQDSLPLTIQWFDENTRELLDQETIDKAGVLEVKGYGKGGRKVAVKVVPRNGKATVMLSDGTRFSFDLEQEENFFPHA